MSAGKQLSALPTATALGTSDYLMAIVGGAAKRVLPTRLNFVEVGQKETAESTVGVVDFFRKYGSTATPGTIIGDQLYSNAVVWKVNLGGGVTVNLQNYHCLVMRNVNGLLSTWSYVSLFFIPCHGDQLSAYRVTLSIGSDDTIVGRRVTRLFTGVETLNDKVSLGGVKRGASVKQLKLKGGGVPHEYCEDTYLRDGQGIAASGNDVSSRPSGKSEYSYGTGLIRLFRDHLLRHPSRNICLRSDACGGRRRLLVADTLPSSNKEWDIYGKPHASQWHMDQVAVFHRNGTIVARRKEVVAA